MREAHPSGVNSPELKPMAVPILGHVLELAAKRDDSEQIRRSTCCNNDMLRSVPANHGV